LDRTEATDVLSRLCTTKGKLYNTKEVESSALDIFGFVKDDQQRAALAISNLDNAYLVLILPLGVSEKVSQHLIPLFEALSRVLSLCLGDRSELVKNQSLNLETAITTYFEVACKFIANIFLERFRKLVEAYYDEPCVFNTSQLGDLQKNKRYIMIDVAKKPGVLEVLITDSTDTINFFMMSVAVYLNFDLLD